MVACIATVLLVMAGSAYAGTEEVEETLESTGAGSCEAKTVPDETKALNSVRFKAIWNFDENSDGLEDRWTFTLDVEWTEFPEETDPITGETSGSPPGDDDDDEKIDDIDDNDQEGITGELKTRWWHDDDFDLDGDYKAVIEIEVHHETRSWGDGEWQTSCKDSDDMVFIVDYVSYDGSGGGWANVPVND